jgi:peptidoglycan/LPS O-acetylase OafA/YrhL
MCYSIYLTHRTTVFVLQAMLVRFHLHFWTWLGVSIVVVAPASIVVGAVYFLLIERPCMDPRWPQKLMAWFRSGPRSSPPNDASPELETSRLLANNDTVGA